MSIQERLKIAYENVAYNADKTWRTENFNLQKPNMELFLKESQLYLTNNLALRPRTVRDCIPSSKLARYDNYEYSNSRELSYNMDNVNLPSKTPTSFDKDSEKEVWMSDEVDQLYKFYSNKQNHNNDNKKIYLLKHYESPFLKSSSLLEYFLKLQIINSQVKKLWDVRNKDSECLLRSSNREDPHVLHTSSQKLEFEKEIFEWHRNDQVGITNLNLFTKKGDQDKLKLQGDANLMQHKRLYSAVLQGFSASKLPPLPVENRMTILKRNLTKNGMEKLGRVSEISRTKIENCIDSKHTEEISSIKKTVKLEYSPKSTPNNFNNKSYSNTIKNNVGTVYNPLYTVNNFQSTSMQFDGLHHQNRLFSNNFLSPATTVVSNPPLAPRFRQTYTTNNCQFPSFYMLLQNTLQQQNFLQPLCNPVVLQRSTPVNFERSRPLHVSINNQFVTPQLGNISNKSIISQKKDSSVSKPKAKTKLENSQEKKDAKSSGLISLVNVRKISDISSCSSCNSTPKQDTNNEDSFEDLDKLVLKTVNMVLNDSISETILWVNESSSERLERQALEQYQSSYDNVFSELERQAAEEYEDCSENYKDPPNHKILFGGFLIQCLYFNFPMDKYFKYLVS